MMSTALIVAHDRRGIAGLALDLLGAQLSQAVRMRGEAHLALTGGSSASALYALLASDRRAARIPWSSVHVWQGDERFVATSHEDSNWALAQADWLARADAPAIPPAQLHPIPVDAVLADGGGPDEAAQRYAAEIERSLPRREGLPAFDVVLLGVGGDGHILSVFPGSTALDETSTAAVAVPAPTHIEPHQPRITLVPRLLDAAGLILPMVPGATKSDVIGEIFGRPHDPQRCPAQLAIRPTAVWLLDEECAAGLA